VKQGPSGCVRSDVRTSEVIMSLVVVGMDGSEHAYAALAFAAEEAALRGAALRIVCAWDFPTSMSMDMGLVPGIFEGFREEADLIAAQSLKTVAELQPGVSAEVKVLEGHPAMVLLEQSEEATLLVVGSRGRGGLAGMLLGSVSRHVIHQASCPVTVVRKIPPKSS
jgi:nucleotide-binding universal stress UspA family protein